MVTPGRVQACFDERVRGDFEGLEVGVLIWSGNEAKIE
jgi:hypothetical protein